MKKGIYISIIIFIIIFFIFIGNIFNKSSDSKQNDVDSLKHNESFVFETAYGTVEIDADNALTAKGFAGASNNIFYIKNNNLYFYVHNGEDELYAENVDSIYYESTQSEQIIVKLNNNSKIINESAYLTYIYENEKKFTFETAYGTVEIDADNALTAKGFAGASNNIFYIKNNNLYFYVHNGEDELYTENVDSIYYESTQSEQIIVKLNNNSKIINESTYLTYIYENEKKFTFETAYGTVNIYAAEALTARGSAGASNKIFYIKNNNLYFYVHNGEDELYAENIDSIYYESAQSEQIAVKLNSDSKIFKESSYLDYI